MLLHRSNRAAARLATFRPLIHADCITHADKSGSRHSKKFAKKFGPELVGPLGIESGSRLWVALDTKGGSFEKSQRTGHGNRLGRGAPAGRSDRADRRSARAAELGCGRGPDGIRACAQIREKGDRT